ncbi:MAG: peptidase prolyl oligopeptidase active site domain protein [Acidobacteria bacterium]|nr:peptidase prolyl oligopeptidase active site domain protein [Acidobacteriota bacterium]
MIRIARTRSSRPQLMRKLLVAAFALSLVTFAVMAQQAGAKRPLNHTDYDTWRTIQQQQLSSDAKLLTYALNAQDADGEVVLRVLATGTEWRYNRGHRAETAPATEPDDQGRGAGGRGGGAGGGASSSLAFTPDLRFLVFQVFPTRAENEAARKENRRAADMPRNAMAVMETSTGKVERVERVRRFLVPEEGSSYIAYMPEPKPEAQAGSGRGQDAAAEANPPAGAGGRQGTGGRAGGRQGGAAAGGRGGARTEYGNDLIVRNLADKADRVIPDVLDFSFSRDGKYLTYTVSSRKPESNGVYRIAVGSPDPPTTILAGRGKYTRLSWDEKQTQLVFFSDRDDAAARQPKVKIYYADMANPAAVELVSAATPNLRKEYVIAERGGLSFSRDGSRLFFGAAPPGDVPEEPEESEGATPAPAAAAASQDKVVADLWHWKDDFIQPMQRVRATQERNRTYRAVFHIKNKKLVQLADETMATISPQGDGRWALGSDDRPYRIMVGYEQGNLNDYYLVDTEDGSRKALRTKQSGGLTFSHNARYAMHFDGKDWSSISIPDGKTVNLTKDLGVNFWNENIDTPSTPGSYGIGGWTKDEKYVLLHDRYDIWQVAPDGSGAKNLTDGIGRKEKISFRIVNLRTEPGEAGIDPAQPLLLRAGVEDTLDSGFYRDRIDGGPPQKLIMAAKNFGAPTKAKNADLFTLTASAFNEFPDLLLCGPNFNDMKKVTNANPQRDKILWGTAELIRFNNTDGVPLKGVLFKPENFNPKQKYPMMVYIYERLSNNLHNFVNPSPGTSINVSYYVSNGYLVLEPDIVYTVGYPGQSALKCVLPAIQAVVDKGFVNEDAIGIQGHSWGGYQISYMVTRTNRFKAAEAGAPVSNMTSAYSGIRWGTGMPRQFQYEHTQSRIGGSLWEKPMQYFENSPVFWADRVETPLLILHNDNDDAVPWYQGIEYYLALRRLGKEVYMFVYNGEPHGLRKRVNMKDYAVRMQQFFDHKLKGAPMPEWMEKGIPYLEREKEKEKIKAIYDPDKK